MPKKANAGKTVSFTVTLSEGAAAMMDRLIGIGLHGSSRAEVARTLILSRLEQLSGPVLSMPKEPPTPATPAPSLPR